MSAIVLEKDLLDFLTARGADRDENGFLVAGPEPPSSFMGAGEELLLPATLTYLMDGKPRPLAEELLLAGIGVRVQIAGEAGR